MAPNGRFVALLAIRSVLATQILIYLSDITAHTTDMEKLRWHTFMLPWAEMLIIKLGQKEVSTYIVDILDILHCTTLV